MRLATLPIGGLFVLAAVSQAKLQTIEQRHTIALADATKRYELSHVDRASRGTILTSDGRPLAKDEDSYDLNVNFSKCPQSEAFWVELAGASGIPATEFSTLADAGVRSRTWPQAISQAERDAVDRVRSRWRADGVSSVWTGRRDYPMGEATACFVGVIRKDGLVVEPGDRRWDGMVRKYGMPKGKPVFVRDMVTGLEASRDDDLEGRNGIQRGLTDRSGNFLPMRGKDIVQTKKDGQNLTLTIDSEIQTLAFEAVRKVVDKYKAESGVALVMDPHTGDLLAMANWPSFKPYNPDGSAASMGEHGGLDQAYQSVLEPGSMFKVLTLAKALDTGKVHMGDTLYCPGEWHVQKRGKPIRCDAHAGHRAHGVIDPRMAIAKSCNIAAAHWALKIGQDDFVEYMRSLGLLRKPRLGLPGETRALFREDKYSPILQLATLGFGQSINCTPVALMGAFGTIANGGVRLEPRLVKRIGARDLPVEPGEKLLKPESCDAVIRSMEAVFEEKHGTGYSMRVAGYHLAGKTGTAQKLAPGDHGYVSNFIGFVPAKNPKAVVMVMVNKPTAAYYGATVAGPAWLEIAKGIIRKDHLPPDAPIVATDVANGKAKPAHDL